MNQQNKKIVYFLPDIGIFGGVAVVLQHTNRLKQRGYDVLIVNNYGSNTKVDWFKKNEVKIITWRDYNDIKYNACIAIATHFRTVSTVENIKSDRKIYFVQSDERRFGLSFDDFSLCNSTYNKNNFEYMTEAIWIQRWLKDEFGHDVYYVPNGLDKELFYEVDNLGKGFKKRILIEGSIDVPFKGMQEAYDAVKDLDVELWIVSNCGTPKKDWKYDKFYNNIPIHKMRDLYSSCDVFLKMSKVEGFFGPPLEAMACGCAVVVGKCTGYDEYIVNEGNGLVVEKSNVNSARQAIKRLLNDQKLINKLIKQGRKTVEKWSWDRSIDFLECVILNKEKEIMYNDNFPEQYNFDLTIRNVLNDIALKQNDNIRECMYKKNIIEKSKFWKIQNVYMNAKNTILGK